MPSIDDIYPDNPMYRGEAAYERPRYSTRTPEVVTPSPAVPPKVDALTLFREDPAALRASALAVLDVKIDTPKTVAAAAHLSNTLSEAATVVKNVEARRLLIVEPIKKQAAAVDAEARNWKDPVIAWMARAKLVITAFNKKQADDAARAAAAQQDAIREAAKQLGQAEIMQSHEAIEKASTKLMHLEAEAPAQAVRGYKTDAGSTYTIKTWRVEVVDESEVPDAYLVVDLKKLQAAVDAGAREIPGCNVFEHETLGVRTR